MQDAATKVAVLSAAIFGREVNPVSRQELLNEMVTKDAICLAILTMTTK